MGLGGSKVTKATAVAEASKEPQQHPKAAEKTAESREERQRPSMRPLADANIHPPASLEIPGLLGLLDDDSLLLIARHLPLNAIGRMGQCCKALYFLLKNFHFWLDLYTREHPNEDLSLLEPDVRQYWRKLKTVENMLLYRQPVYEEQEAHPEGVGVMYLKDDTLITGGKDDSVRMWDVSEFPFRQTASITNVGKWVWGYDYFRLLLLCLICICLQCVFQ